MHRREFLTGVGASSAVVLAGCSETADSGGDSDPDEEGTTAGTASPEGKSDGDLAPGNDTPGSTEVCSITQAAGDVEATPVTADGTFEEASAVVDLRWNARSQRSVKENPDDYVGSEADPGQKFVVFRVEVTNTTDGIVTVDEYNFTLDYQTPDTVGTATSAIDVIDEIDFQIRADGTVRGLLTFIVPADATSAILRPREPNFPDRQTVAFVPECDRSLPVDTPMLEE